MSESEQELQQIGLESIRVHLHGYGFATRSVEDSVVIDNINGVQLTCCCQQFPTPSTQSAMIAFTVEVSLTLAQGATSSPTLPQESIREVVVALHHDKRAGAIQATHNWCVGVFPAIVCALNPGLVNTFKDQGIAPQALNTKRIMGTQVAVWEICAGVPQVSGQSAAPLVKRVYEDDFLESLKSAFYRAIMQEQVRWIKMYVAFMPNGNMTFECKLDNENWPEGLVALKAVGWPRVDGFAQYRQFFALCPTATGGLELLLGNMMGMGTMQESE